MAAVEARPEAADLRLTASALASALARLDTGPDAAFDALARQAARAANAPVATLSLHAGGRPACLAAVGLLRDEAGRLLALGGRVVAHGHAQVVRGLDGATTDDPAAQCAAGLGLSVCVGVPVRAHGQPVGALCVFADAAWMGHDGLLQSLHDLATACGGLLQARLAALAPSAATPQPPAQPSTPSPAPAQADAVRPAPPDAAAGDRLGAAGAWAQQLSRARTLDARLRAVLGAVPDLWFVVDDEGRYRHCSDPMHPALIAPFEAISDRSMLEVLPPEVARASFDAMRRARETGQPQRIEYALKLPGGEGWFEARISPMPGGELLYLVRDVTELRRLAAEARLNEERWEFALAGAGHGVWDWNADTGRTYFSTYWKAMLGYEPHEIGDRWDEWSSRVHPDDLPRVMDALRRYQTGDASAYEVDYRMRHRDGRELWIRDRARIVARRDDGSPRRMIGTQSDITRQRVVEAQLRDKQAAELASRSKSEFLSRMSHEMRTPLNAVIGFAQLLRLQGGARTDYVDHVLQASQHLLTLINDVLDLQQVEEGRLVLHPTRVDPGALAAACATLLQPLAQARGVTQRMPAPSAPQAAVTADEQRLRQVLLNIGSNAIKYNRPGGQVRWSVEPGDDGWPAIVVEDTGSGMTDDQQRRLFQPFERLGRESTIEGSGLGLLIARRLVEDMGGTLSLSSQPGVGTRVRIALPPQAPQRALPAEPAGNGGPVAAAQGTPPLRLLYLEDNRVNALLFTEALRQHTDIELHLAETGAELFEQLDTVRPDVFVLDAHLPDCSGYDVLARLRTMPATADKPAYMCSADASPEDIARALAAGFAGYWTKPLDLSLILADLRRLGAGHPDTA